MSRHFLLFVSFAFLIILGVIHWMASLFNLYWELWWFDSIVHFWGGLSIGVFSLWIANVFGWFGHAELSFRRILKISFGAVLVIGVGWEVFEYLFDIADPTIGETYLQDTSFDLVLDLLGSLLAALVGRGGRSISFNTLAND